MAKLAKKPARKRAKAKQPAAPSSAAGLAVEEDADGGESEANAAPEGSGLPERDPESGSERDPESEPDSGAAPAMPPAPYSETAPAIADNGPGLSQMLGLLQKVGGIEGLLGIVSSLRGLFAAFRHFAPLLKRLFGKLVGRKRPTGKGSRYSRRKGRGRRRMPHARRRRTRKAAG